MISFSELPLVKKFRPLFLQDRASCHKPGPALQEFLPCMPMRPAGKFIIFFVIINFYSLFTEAFCAVENNVSNDDVIKEIEKSLLFDQDARQKIDFYSRDKSYKHSNINISAGDDQNQEKSKTVDIVVVDGKINNFDLRQKEKLAYNSALIGQYEVAIELYKQVLAFEPDNIYAKFSLAVMYQKIGQLRQAKTLYYELLKDNAPNQEEIIGNLLAVLVEESPQDAVYLLSNLAVENPKSPYIFAQFAIAYDKIKNYEQAINLLQKAITLDADNINYQYNLAVIYDKTAQYEKALDLYSSVARNDSGQNQSIPFEQIQKRIDSIKNKL
jgi:tetratricopeptide (TPR) repeat protein